MSLENITKTVWVCGIYNWPVTVSKEERMRNKEYPRHNWVDIDTTNINNFNQVLEIFKQNSISCISQKCGKGWHFWGDLVDYDLWLKIWTDVKPYADPRWAPHTLRISKKRIEEVWEQPIFHYHGGTIKPWMKAVMHFICKAMRSENSTNLWNSMHSCGIHKYFQGTVYQVELK